MHRKWLSILTLTLVAGTTPSLADPGPGEIELNVDVVTGEMELVGNQVTSSGFQIISQSGSIVPDGGNNPSPFDLYLSNTMTLASAASFAGTLIDGIVPIGLGFDILDGQEDFVFSYGVSGQTGDPVGIVNYIPEPASMAVLPLVWLVYSRRRKSAA